VLTLKISAAHLAARRKSLQNKRYYWDNT